LTQPARSAGCYIRRGRAYGRVYTVLCSNKAVICQKIAPAMPSGRRPFSALSEQAARNGRLHLGQR
jgi:hypothetical protein